MSGDSQIENLQESVDETINRYMQSEKLKLPEKALTGCQAFTIKGTGDWDLSSRRDHVYNYTEGSWESSTSLFSFFLSSCSDPKVSN